MLKRIIYEGIILLTLINCCSCDPSRRTLSEKVTSVSSSAPLPTTAPTISAPPIKNTRSPLPPEIKIKSKIVLTLDAFSTKYWWSPLGKYFVFYYHDLNGKESTDIYDLASGKKISIPGDPDSVNFSPDEKQIIMYTDRISVYDTSTGEELYSEIPNSRLCFGDTTYINDNLFLVRNGDWHKYSLSIWDREKHKCIENITKNFPDWSKGSVGFIKIPDKNEIITGYYKSANKSDSEEKNYTKKYIIWELDTQKMKCEINEFNERIMGIDINRKFSYAIFETESKFILYNFNCEKIKELPNLYKESIFSFEPNGQYLYIYPISKGYGQTLFLIDLNDGKQVAQFDFPFRGDINVGWNGNFLIRSNKEKGKTDLEDIYRYDLYELSVVQEGQ